MAILFRRLLHYHMGVRAQGMILAAAVWGMVGLGILIQPAANTPSALHLLLPAWVRAAMWWLPAGVALGVSAHRRWSSWGLGLLQLGPIIYGVSFLGAWLMDLIPGPPPGDPRGWVSASYYLLMVAFISHLSHIPPELKWPLFQTRVPGHSRWRFWQGRR